MTKSQEIQIRLSELREKINGLLGKADRSDAETVEMREATTKATEAEVELRAALVVDGPAIETITTEDAETRERRQLARDAQVGAFIASAIAGKGIEGRERELSDAYGLPGGFMPLAIFDVGRPEVRAVTPGVTALQNAAPVVPFAFERSAMASLGFTMPMVGSGQANYPVISTGAPAGSVDKGVAASSTAAAFRLDTRTPKRIAGQFEIRVEDLAVFPEMEAALRESVIDASSNALDEQGFNGSGSTGQLDGLFNQATDVTKATAKETFATGVARFAALVDGQYAYSWSNIRAVIGSSTFALYAGLFQSNGDVSLYDYLASKLGSLRVSNRVPDVASMGQKAITVLDAPMVDLRLPVWQGVEIIVDPYSKAGEGVKVCTATTLVGSPHVPYGTSQLKELHPKIS